MAGLVLETVLGVVPALVVELGVREAEEEVVGSADDVLIGVVVDEGEQR